MATYSSKPVTVNSPANELFARLSDFSNFQNRLDSLPEAVREKVGQVRFTPDSIVITASPVGEMVFNVTERREPSLIKLSAQNSPVALDLCLNIAPTDDVTSEVVSSIEVDIPIMLKPMVGPQMQQAAEKFAELIKTFFNNESAD